MSQDCTESQKGAVLFGVAGNRDRNANWLTEDVFRNARPEDQEAWSRSAILGDLEITRGQCTYLRKCAERDCYSSVRVWRCQRAELSLARARTQITRKRRVRDIEP